MTPFQIAIGNLTGAHKYTPPEPQLDENERLCANPNCKEPFYPRRVHQLYHSQRCYDAMRPKKKPAEPKPVNRICNHCGKEYKTASGGIKYCSRQCNDNAKYLRRKIRDASR